MYKLKFQLLLGNSVILLLICRVVEDISESIVAVNTERGSHCLDLYTPSVNDPDWLVAQRDKETKIIAQWITDYAKPKKN